MKLDVTSTNDSLCTVACAGNIRVPDFGVGRDPIEEALGATAYNGKLFINLEDVTAIDSSGVSWLLRCHKRYRDSGGVMVLHSIPPIVNNVLNLLRMEQVLYLAKDESAAHERAEQVVNA